MNGRSGHDRAPDWPAMDLEFRAGPVTPPKKHPSDSFIGIIRLPLR